MSAHRTLVLIGGGPRAIGVLERLVENGRRDAAASTLDVHLVDPYRIGPGRIWRREQSAELRLNSLAGEVSLFSDRSSTFAGPIAPGPSLYEWAHQVHAGTLRLSAALTADIDDGVRAEIARITPRSFPSRRLQSHYLRWFYERARDRAPSGWRVIEHRGTVVGVHDADAGAGHELDVTVAEGTGRDADVRSVIAADAVLYAIGHVDAQVAPRHRAIAQQAAAHGLRYQPPGYASDVDLDGLTAHDTVLLRGAGLSFIDLVVRLTVDRGGHYAFDPDKPLGQRVTYVASGREPRILTGSRRGVPYHAKTTSRVQGEDHGFATTFFTTEWLRHHLDAHLEAWQRVDFVADVWPWVQGELGYAYYRELFSGHPDRVRGSWAELRQLVQAAGGVGTPVVDAWLRARVDDDDRLDLARLQHPLAEVRAESPKALGARLRTYLLDDLRRHETDEHSEQTALVQAIIGCTFVLAETLDHPAWSDAAQAAQFTGFWQNLFSFIASGPPGERLELLLALADAGVLEFLGSIDDVQPTAGGYEVHSRTLDERRTADVLIEAYQPQCSVSASANPALGDLHRTGLGHERRLRVDGRAATNGKLVVAPASFRVVAADGHALPNRWALGEFTDVGRPAAFARPDTNAPSFRYNDRVARAMLASVGLLDATMASSCDSTHSTSIKETTHHDRQPTAATPGLSHDRALRREEPARRA
ncbi:MULTISPECIES: FAD/NAD(P)-binding protein [unclassified Pseudoclavibacter]|uniref:FAD/NAD(P)-binding protein n=1 Tax=unclassified Pseudoclavibacter TaxID=2615177 RepID=UPI0013011E25|nr:MULTISPECIES: FAD/NAD(P)-binding protein [unclassified Pseudoclavibacter]KAB1644456.1 FAD/NAD(P)-binding protein [Pseudoclavibacter sp. CFCC 14310]KAB1664040.1 FAD/NAD(P)-binding protein [Pseudoclavibacter sp. CFCC 13611]